MLVLLSFSSVYFGIVKMKTEMKHKNLALFFVETAFVDRFVDCSGGGVVYIYGNIDANTLHIAHI